MTFTPDGSHQVIWGDIDILNDTQVVRKLNKFEKASKTLDSTLYFTLGIALIGKVKIGHFLSFKKAGKNGNNRLFLQRNSETITCT